MEDVYKSDQRSIVGIAVPVASEIGQVLGQWPVRTEHAQEIHEQANRFFCLFGTFNGGGSK